MKVSVIKKKVVPILKKHGVRKAAVFGSYARGDFDQKSDVDFLLDLKQGTTLFDLAGLKISLEATLERKVDIVTYDAIYHRLRDIILDEQQIIYEK